MSSFFTTKVSHYLLKNASSSFQSIVKVEFLALPQIALLLLNKDGI